MWSSSRILEKRLAKKWWVDGSFFRWSLCYSFFSWGVIRGLLLQDTFDGIGSDCGKVRVDMVITVRRGHDLAYPIWKCLACDISGWVGRFLKVGICNFSSEVWHSMCNITRAALFVIVPGIATEISNPGLDFCLAALEKNGRKAREDFARDMLAPLSLASSPVWAKNGRAPGTHCLCMRLISPRCGDSGLFSDSSKSCYIRVRTRYSKLVKII